MFVIKTLVLILVFCDFIPESGSLETFSNVGDDFILVTESILRNTTNKLFISLNLKRVKQSPKLSHFSLIHNFLTSVALRDHRTLKEITSLTRVDKNNINNETLRYMILLNEILNEDASDNEIDSISQKDAIVEYVEQFLTNLEWLKEKVGYIDEYHKLDINEEILKILRSDNNVGLNMTRSIRATVRPDYDDSILSDNEFWVPEPRTRRIYRGERTKIKYFPFMAIVQIFNNFQCGGSIIKSDLVITASSCVQLAWNNRFYRENPAFLSVRVGSKFYNGGGESIPVLEVYFHPEYNPKNLRNNICLLRLLRKLKFRRRKKRVKKIEIDTSDTPLPLTTEGVTIVGWGARGLSNIIGDPWSNRLAFTVLDVYHLRECQEIYSREYVTKTNFCAGSISKGGGACNRDVGGPGIVNGYLTGIVSFGSPVCGTPDSPTVFTKVGYYADWIEHIMEQDVPTRNKGTTLRRPAFHPPMTTKKTYTSKAPFRLPPMGGDNLEPILLHETDPLRILENEDLFKEFLSTMFGSSEAEDYKGLIADKPIEKSIDSEAVTNTSKNIKPKNHKAEKSKAKQKTIKIDKVTGEMESQEREHLVGYTKLMELENTPEPAIKHTVIDESLELDQLLDSNIAEVIDDIELSDSDEETVTNKGSIEKLNKAKVKKITDKLKAEDPTDDDVLTLLYISDNEKTPDMEHIGSIVEDFDENLTDGLAIDEEGFKDLTFRNNKTKSIFDFMTNNELYDLLSEAIDNIARNKDIKPFYILFSQYCKDVIMF